jgi:S1-C subfamily serine protease
MDLVTLFERSQSGIVQVIHVRNGHPLGFGSGFFVKDHLATNYHVAAAALAPANAKDLICIRFHDDLEGRARVALPCHEFVKRVKGASEEHSFDYLIASCPEALAVKPYQFEFSSTGEPQVGQFVAFQGYPFGQSYLAAHAGNVSSIFPSKAATMIQLDASVNSGNSGGPLFDAVSGKLLGVVSRKQTGLVTLSTA